MGKLLKQCSVFIAFSEFFNYTGFQFQVIIYIEMVKLQIRISIKKSILNVYFRHF